MIGFVFGVFLAGAGILITGLIGIFVDKSRGEATCRTFGDRINNFMMNPTGYHYLKTDISRVTMPSSSNLCLGTIWLKYQIKVENQTFYYEEGLCQSVNKALYMHIKQ